MNGRLPLDEPVSDTQHSDQSEKIESRTRSRRSWPMMIIGLVVGVFGTLFGLAIIAGRLALAHRSNFPLERANGSFAVSVAARFHSGNQATPVVQDSRAIESGRSAYTGSCSICHGLDGTGKGILGKATYPNATDLTSENAIEMSDSQLYWIIANGLSFTGMPGFNSQYKSQDIWSIVSYIRTLQKQGSERWRYRSSDRDRRPVGCGQSGGDCGRTRRGGLLRAWLSDVPRRGGERTGPAGSSSWRRRSDTDDP